MRIAVLMQRWHVTSRSLALAGFIHGVAQRAALDDPAITMVNRVLAGSRLKWMLDALSSTPESERELTEICRVFGEVERERRGGA